MADETTTTSETTTTTQAPWYGQVDADTLGYIQNRGLDKITPDKAALAAIQAHREAEKLIGVPQDQLLRIPKDNDVEGWNKVHAKLGVPADAKEYDFANVKYSDGSAMEEDEVNELRSIASELKLSKSTATLLAQRLVKIAETEGTRTKADYDGKMAIEQTNLKNSWGQNFAANKVVAENAAKAFGLTDEDLAGFQKATGYAKMMEFFRSVGQRTGEDKFVSNGARPNGPMTKEEASYKMDQLSRDSVWYEKYSKGDQAAVKEFNDLTRMMAGL